MKGELASPPAPSTLAALYAGGLQNSDIARLAALKRRVEAERRAETAQQHRLVFIKKLVESGLIHD